VKLMRDRTISYSVSIALTTVPDAYPDGLPQPAIKIPVMTRQVCLLFSGLRNR